MCHFTCAFNILKNLNFTKNITCNLLAFTCIWRILYDFLQLPYLFHTLSNSDSTSSGCDLKNKPTWITHLLYGLSIIRIIQLVLSSEKTMYRIRSDGEAALCARVNHILCYLPRVKKSFVHKTKNKTGAHVSARILM